MLGEEAVGAEGVLKMNCKVLDSSQLKRYDKQEKTLAQEIHGTGKGKKKDSWEELLIHHIYGSTNKMSASAWPRHILIRWNPVVMA